MKLGFKDNILRKHYKLMFISTLFSKTQPSLQVHLKISRLSFMLVIFFAIYIPLHVMTLHFLPKTSVSDTILLLQDIFLYFFFVSF